ncbi:MAG TPA: hypothetical protein VM914_09730, partial [Pyrinomonadaceae bacterium]|nr:hypothetical protein [Pyrinomonadaceae bacterium]
MTFDRRLVAYGFVFVLFVTGCKLGDRLSNSGGGNNANANRSSRASASPTPAAADAGVTGVEKQKPEPGKGNVQGKVVYNGKPVENIDVQLCEKFNRFYGGCSGGKIYKAKTDADGVYVVANV